MSLSAAAAQDVVQSERVIRLEMQRRAVRECLVVHEQMIGDVDVALAHVQQMKRAWLEVARVREDARLELVEEEATERNRIEAGAQAYSDGIVYHFMRPLMKRLDGADDDL